MTKFFKKFSLHSKGGFTLIELLVVIAIIGVLSSIVLVSLDQARQKARDARRLADIQEIRKALELYAFDHSGKYPPRYTARSSATSSASGTTAWSVLATDLSPYISELPTDPVNSGAYAYMYGYAPCEGEIAKRVFLGIARFETRSPRTTNPCGITRYAAGSSSWPLWKNGSTGVLGRGFVIELDRD